MGSDYNSGNDTTMQPSEPTLCSNGCGFFGTAATEGLCSKCYRDLTVHESQAAQAKSAVEKSFTPSPSLFLKTEKKAVVGEAEASEVKPSAVAEAAVEVVEVKKVPNRCGTCNKKVGLTGFKCRCGLTFCGSHRYAEEHDCQFDFKGKGKDDIAKANPVVKADKLNKV